MSLIDMIPQMTVLEKPSLILTPEDVAELSGYSLRRINDLRTRTRIAEGQCGPEYFRPADSKKRHEGHQGLLHRPGRSGLANCQAA